MSAATTEFAPQGGRGSRPDLRRWKRRSRMIAVFRRLLPILIGLVIVSLAGQVVWNSIVARNPQDDERSDPIRMVNPRFQGREGNGRSFVISAASATRDDRNLKRVMLERTVVVMGVDTPKPTRVRANSGVYIEGDPIVRLEGDVQVDDASGYHFVTDKADLDTSRNTVQAQSPLVGTGPIGEVRSQSYGVYDDGDRIIFRGGVRAKINQE